MSNNFRKVWRLNVTREVTTRVERCGNIVRTEGEKGHQGAWPQLVRKDRPLPTRSRATCPGFQSTRRADATQRPGHLPQTQAGTSAAEGGRVALNEQPPRATASRAALSRPCCVHVSGGDSAAAPLRLWEKAECPAPSKASHTHPPASADAHRTPGSCANPLTRHRVTAAPWLGFLTAEKIARRPAGATPPPAFSSRLVLTLAGARAPTVQ